MNDTRLNCRKVVDGAGLIGAKPTMHRLLNENKLSFNYAKRHCKVLRPPKHTPWYRDKRYPHDKKDTVYYLRLLVHRLKRLQDPDRVRMERH